MIIKKYIVDDMKEAMIRAKYELGSEAMILSQRYIKEGKWYNPFKKKRIEVTVALETQNKKNSPKEKKIRSKTKENSINITEEQKGNIKYNFDNRILEGSSDKIKGKLKSYCKFKGLEEDKLNLEDIREFLEIGFKKNPFKQELKAKKINILVGPTGVGKTTTIAKLAARGHLEENKKVGIITIDTYKIGAVEQIKTYADILGLPFEVVNRVKDMEGAVERLAYCDRILIDTLGASQRNQGKLNDIKYYIRDMQKYANTYLVASVSTDKKTMNSILDKYKELNYNAIILTKFDEVTSYENFWNIIENNPYPVEYFCFGQEVPEDIEKANLDNLISYSEEIYRYD